MSAPGLRTRIAKTATEAKVLWLNERRTYIGATDAGAILGVNPYASPHDVWLAKKGLADEKETIPMRLGTYLEPFIATEYQRVTGVAIRKSRLYRHPKFPQFASNPDREVTLTHDGQRFDGLLECKSVGHFASKNFGQDGSDQIPEHYMVQVMWQLLTTGKDFVHLAALIDNRELRVFTYTLKAELSGIAHVFDADLCRTAFAVCGKFWADHIVGDAEPPMTGHDSDTEWLKNQRPSYENGQKVLAAPDIDAHCVALGDARSEYDRAALRKAELENLIKKEMAEREVSCLESSVGDFNWKTDARGVARFTTPFKSNKS